LPAQVDSAVSAAEPKYWMDWLIMWSARLNLTYVTARLVRLTIETQSAPNQPGGAAAQPDTTPRVLLLRRRGFTDDILTTLSSLGSVKILVLKRRTLKAIAAAFLPSYLDDNNYVATPSSLKAMERYRAFLSQFWAALDPHRRIDAVISGNFGYYAEQEFAAALETLNVPFIALHKENSWSPGNQAFWERVYRERRGPFKGRRILVYSPIERDLQLRAGVATSEKIETVGMPRLDEVHRWRVANIGKIPKPTVLFASFSSEVGMPVLKTNTRQTFGQPRNLSITELCTSAHRAVASLAASCPEITVLVKTKGRERDRSALPRLLGVDDEKDLPKNIRLFHGGSPLPLLSEASVVCGVHSTLLLEALAAGRPVIVPWYAEALDPEIRWYLFDLGAAAITVSSPTELKERLREVALTRQPVPAGLSPATVKVLREWLGNEDGKAGQRAAAAILHTIRAAGAAQLGSRSVL
jgi:hypothetical protein